MRGKADPVLPADLARRITPACAGKRNRAKELVEKYKDHPRVCGEKSSFDLLARHISGSPPRVRGKVLSAVLVVWMLGITPACAGKSLSRSHKFALFKDHPRVCGEKWYIHQRCWQRIGSPPRVRGKVVYPSEVLAEDRITPACAGKRQLRAAHKAADTDHPRVCGEKRVRGIFLLSSIGSPPRVRGKAKGLKNRYIISRITPACAGKSFNML